MQCKSCNTELPKKAKVCPKCGELTGKKAGNLKVIAVIGLVIAMIGGLLPFVQNTSEIKDAYSFMNIQASFMWYLYIAAIVIAVLLLIARKDVLSIIPTVAAGVIYAVSFVGFKYRHHSTRKKFTEVELMDLLQNGSGEDSYAIGFGVFVVIIGLIIAIVGCFIDIMKYFKKDLGVDAKYLTNSINQSVWSKMWYYRGFYLMFIPVLVAILIFYYWPMLGVRFAFTQYRIADPFYVGVKHFVQMFTTDTFFWSSFRNTLFLATTRLILNTGAAVIISLLLHEIVNIWFKKTVQTIIYLPHFMSWVVVAAIFRMILDPNDTGVINGLLIDMGIVEKGNGIFFMGDVKYWQGTFFAMSVWKDTGWGTILFLATLSGISPDLYEAAQIDGANRWKRLLYITLPALVNTILTVFILNLAKVMNLFEAVFVTSTPGTIAVSEVLQTYVYSKTFGSSLSDYGYSTAVGLFKSVVGMILVLGCNWASKKVRGRGII